MQVVTAETMQKLDRRAVAEAGIPGRVLMENAGRGAAGEILRSYPHIRGERGGVIAGRGNNGGDGFVIARYLLGHGVAVKVFVLTSLDAVSGDARANLDLLLKMRASVTGTSVGVRTGVEPACIAFGGIGTGLRVVVEGCDTVPVAVVGPAAHALVS